MMNERDAAIIHLHMLILIVCLFLYLNYYAEFDSKMSYYNVFM